MAGSPPDGEGGVPTARGPTRALLVALAVVLATVPGAAVPAATGPGTTGGGVADSAADGTGDAGRAASQAGDPPPDPPEDVLGWEAGYWANETVAVDQSDGVNASELDALVARTMARVEAIRELEFERTVPVEVVDREAFRRQQARRTPPEAFRRFDNQGFEALLMVNETTDSVAVQDRNAGSSVLGFYSPLSDSVVLVAEDATVDSVDERTLAHELFHALQDRRWDLTSFERTTTEGANVVDGLIEGDAELVDALYARRCDGPWNGTCFVPPEEAAADLANAGPFVLRFQPRSDGPKFLSAVRNRSGWAGVNDLYGRAPVSTEQFIHPERYPWDAPTKVELPDRSGPGWRPVDVPGRPDVGVLGEAGVFSMFLFPSFDTNRSFEMVTRAEFRRVNAAGEPRPIHPFDYDHPLSAGWDGDAFVAYRSDDGDAGYVWRLLWDSEADAREFVDGYRRLLAFRNAVPVDGPAGTFRVPEGEEFADAFRVERRNATVTIVNAPSVDQLDEVHPTTESEANGTRG